MVNFEERHWENSLVIYDWQVGLETDWWFLSQLKATTSAIEFEALRSRTAITFVCFSVADKPLVFVDELFEQVKPGVSSYAADPPAVNVILFHCSLLCALTYMVRNRNFPLSSMVPSSNDKKNRMSPHPYDEKPCPATRTLTHAYQSISQDSVVPGDVALWLVTHKFAESF